MDACVTAAVGASGDVASSDRLRPINFDNSRLVANDVDELIPNEELEEENANFHDADEPEPPDLNNLNKFPRDPSFENHVHEIELAILSGILPERIWQGSSGSYFVRNQQKDIVAVFKPKSEEPYSVLNPKYTKWCQRMCCPCCFGRKCLLHNQGYLSEAGASLVSDWLQLDIVPKTKVVWLASESFNYSRIAKAKSNAKKEIMAKTPVLGKHFKRLGLPLKAGSLQIFVKGYENADECLRRFSYEQLPQKTMQNFQVQFDKLVILDYIIRNTDRGNDNWLIKIDLSSEEEKPSEENDGVENWNVVQVPKISIAAIDNGLAFPFKHPDTWRTYPYQWAWLQPYSDVPFSDEIVQLVLPKISNFNLVEGLICDLQQLFSIDRGFTMGSFEKQMSVMRGQILNLCEALDQKMTPAQLVEMPLRTVEKKKPSGTVAAIFHRLPHFSNVNGNHAQYRETFQQKKPFFTWC